MPKKREHSQPTRQIYASIREDIYLAAKTRAAELRVPMRRFIEDALSIAVNSSDLASYGIQSDDASHSESIPPSVWDDQYIDAQARQPLGAPLDLSEDEARRVALGAFGFSSQPARTSLPNVSPDQSPLEQSLIDTGGRVGDPVEISDEDAEKIARGSLEFDAFRRRRVPDG